MRIFHLLFFCFLFSTGLHAQMCYPPSLDFGALQSNYGTAVTVNGDNAAVLAIGDGAIYVYTQTDSAWQRSARIALPNLATPLNSEALLMNTEGNEIIVGTPGANSGSITRTGAVLVYRKDASGWSLFTSLFATSPQADAYFGGRIAMDGENLLVGSFSYDQAGQPNAGAAYLFRKQTNGSFSAAVQLNAPTPSAFNAYGLSLAVSGNRAIVGSSFESVGDFFTGGKVFVYDISGAPVLMQTLVQPIPAEDAQYGVVLAASGAKLIIANAPAPDILNPIPTVSQAFSYIFNGTQYEGAEIPLALAPSERIFDIAIVSDRAVFGIIPYDISGIGVNERVIVRNLADATQRTIFSGNTNRGRGGLPSFGISVATDGATIIVGASGQDVGSNVDQGSASLFNFSTGAKLRQLQNGSGRAPSQLGQSAVGVGSTVWVGEPGFDGRTHDLGRVIELIPDVNSWRLGRSIEGQTSFQGFGAVIARKGELLAVASPNASVSGTAGAGRVHIYRSSAVEGSTDSVNLVCELVPPIFAPTTNFGEQLSISGNRVAVAHGPPGDRRVHIYNVAQNQCSLQASVAPENLGLVNGEDLDSFVFVDEQIAMGASSPTGGRIFIMKPSATGYAVLTTLSQPAGGFAPFARALVATADKLAVYRSPVREDSALGAVLLYNRVGDSYTLTNTLVDTATPGSMAAAAFTDMAINNDKLIIGSRTSTGERSFLQAAFTASTWTNGAVLANAVQAGAIFMTNNRVGLGLSAGLGRLPSLGEIRAVQINGVNFDAVTSRIGNAAEVQHCDSLESILD